MISLAVFDMAGTTINDGGAVYRALEQAVVESGVPVAAADLQTWMGTEKRAAITALIELGGGDPLVPANRVDLAYDRFRALLGEHYAAKPPTAIDGVPEAIAALRARGIRVGLTTGFSREVATGILSALGWSVGDTAPGGSAGVTVDALVCGDEVLEGRPAPYMIHRVMEQLGVHDTAAVLVGGDTVVDVQAGVNSGASITVGVLTGKLTRDDFVASGVGDLRGVVILDGVSAVPALLERTV